MNTKGDCSFCDTERIINFLPPPDSAIKCNKLIYEDDTSFAVLCAEQYSRGHTLVILKNHAIDIMNSSDDDLQKFSNAIKKVARNLKDKATNLSNEPPDKIYVSMLSDGVEHLHAHLIPRYPFTDLDRAFYKEWFMPRDRADELDVKIRKGSLGGFWYMALRERNWRFSDFGVKLPEERAKILEKLAEYLKMN